MHSVTSGAADADELIRLRPNDGYGYHLRGRAYWAVGQTEAAKADLETAARLAVR